MKILVIGPSWIGDMVMAQTLFRCLKRKHPDCQIDVMAPDWSRPLLMRMPQVNAALSLPFPHGELKLGSRRRLGVALRETVYDQAIVLPNSFKSALIPFFAKIPVRTGWRGEARGWLLNDCRSLDKARYPLMIQRFAALAWPDGQALPDELPYPRLDADAGARDALFAKFSLQPERPLVVFCPGAEFGPAKKWPERHYAALAETLINRGWQLGLLGSAKDAGTTEAIKEALSASGAADCHDLAGRTELGEVIDLLACASLVVSNDSGLMHIAAALDKPLVVLYGSTSPDFTPPLSKRVQSLFLKLDCSPCFKRECPLGHLNCLEQLAPKKVLDAIDKLELGV